MREIGTDVLVFGGGVTGLWLLHALRARGLGALLLEREALGEGQTAASQGIIHGGLKYALTGKLTADAEAMLDVPRLWRDCLEGRGEVDLRGTRILSESQLLWSPGSLASRVATFFASRLLASRVEALGEEDWPAVFRVAPRFRGTVYRLDEVVLDLETMLARMAQPLESALLRVDWPGGVRIVPMDGGGVDAVELDRPGGGEGLRIRPGALVVTAGAGNRELVEAAGATALPRMQLRPLHQVMARPFDEPLWAHCMGVGNIPRMTITSHPLPDGRWTWYLGGRVSEEGVGRPEPEQVRAGREELANVLPWVDLEGKEWSTLTVDRAEEARLGGLKPTLPTVSRVGNVVQAWPTKLAFAPRTAREVLAALEETNRARPTGGAGAIEDWPRPPVATPPWLAPRRWYDGEGSATTTEG